jgi:hypothetical protein
MDCDPGLLGLLMMLAIRGHHSRLPHQTKLRDTFDFEHLARQLANLHPEVSSCHPNLAAALEGVDGSSFDALQDEARDLLDETLDRLEAMPIRDRIVFRLAVQFCFSCLLESDKALLINKDDAQYLGSPGITIAPTVVEDHPPSSESSPDLHRHRRKALASVIDDATTNDLNDLRPRLLTLPT